MSVNRVILLGNVGRDPEVRYPQQGFAVAYFSLATNETRPDGMKTTEWHNIVMAGKAAEFAERYIRKGTKLFIEGTLRTREYTDRFKIDRKRTEIHVINFEILGRAEGVADA